MLEIPDVCSAVFMCIATDHSHQWQHVLSQSNKSRCRRKPYRINIYKIPPVSQCTIWHLFSINFLCALLVSSLLATYVVKFHLVLFTTLS